MAAGPIATRSKRPTVVMRVAQQYDRYRPAYPVALIDDVALCGRRRRLMSGAAPTRPP